MREREADDTPKPGGPPKPDAGGTRGGYYDDDATGYEVYDPEADAEDGEAEAEE